VTSSELVVRMDGTKFECMISSNDNVIDRMKIQKVKFPQKVACQISSPPTGTILVYICQEVEEMVDYVTCHRTEW